MIFTANAYTSAVQVQEFALLRAAELTLQQGARFFAILDERNLVTTQSLSTPGYSTTTGSVSVSGNTATYADRTTYTPAETYNLYKPQTGLLVKTFPVKPSGVGTFDAESLYRTIKKKHGIK